MSHTLVDMTLNTKLSNCRLAEHVSYKVKKVKNSLYMLTSI